MGVTKHGKNASREHRSWDHAKQRVSNPNNVGYKNYGGRGITMCSEWLTSFERFYRDMGNRPEGTSLDRIDNDKDYSPENCRWATRSEQNRNRRFFGKTLSNTRGVVWCTYTNKWRAVIKMNGKNIHLGRYKDLTEAIKVRKEAELKYWSAA